MIIDTKIIDAHQWIVDQTQKKPGVCAEQAIMAATAVDIVHRVITWKSGWDAVMLLIVLIIAAALVHATKNPVFFKSLGESMYIRIFFLGFVAFHVSLLILEDNVAINLLKMFSTIFMGSFYYFAACDEPKPPKRKEKLVHNLA